MRQRTRKLIGTVLLLALIAIYALVASAVAAARLGEAPAWMHLLYFLFTGLLWVVPAMAVVSWMMKPDKTRRG